MLVESTMMPLGTIAPSFLLPNYGVVGERQISFDAVRGAKGTAVIFWCNHCPYVQHVESAVLALIQHMHERIGFVFISANDPEQYPEDGPKAIQLRCAQHHYPCPYLFDASQSVAKAYDAACTPDTFVFDAEDRCVYRGQIDDTRPGQGVADAKDLSRVCEALCADQAIQAPNTPVKGAILNGAKGTQP